MADYHFVYKDVEGATTQWDDIQRRLGNLPPKPEPFKPPPFVPKVDADEQPKSKEWLDAREPEELEELEDDLDDDRFLEQYRIPECGLLQNCLEELATRYPATKFVKIISTDCIPNYPDRNVPTILVYNNSAVKGTYVGLQKFGGKRCTPESVALALCQSDPVLNDGHGGSDSSRDNVIEGVRRKFIEKVVAQHEEREEEDSD
ncbi:phosducin-like protein 3 isoform X2 [Panicum virgatum]|uniref:phosducin-like protein 3 isoform X2 n=1 Tax=Panicum virgatum TaxID=38727 RepID=UPI0019D55BD2|nr:phosducin-like protein 3 isoform X2 [Panicum virgatum]